MSKSKRLQLLWSLVAALAIIMVGVGGALVKTQAGAPFGQATGRGGPSKLIEADPATNTQEAPGGSVAYPPAQVLPNGVIVGSSIKNDTSRPLRDIKPAPAQTRTGAREMPEPGGEERRWGKPPIRGVDPVVQRWFSPNPLAPLAMPTPIRNFEGVGNPEACGGCLPPDTDLDVGPNHVVQMVNTSYKVWDKNGNSLLGPLPNNQIWDGFGGACDTENDGDPIVLYDSMADRWLLSQFVASAPYGECIAISTSPDPTGSYYRYHFVYNSTVFDDYPHLGVWPDGYYMGANRFNNGSTFAGPSAVVFDRARMLAGLPATFQRFNLGSSVATLYPSDLDGYAPPPAGSPNFFAAQDGYTANAPLRLWKFHVDWVNPANSTFTNHANLAVAPYTPLCPLPDPSFNCVPQPGPVRLDGLGDRLMYRLAYRNFGTHESLATNIAVDVGVAGTQAAIRWYEVRSPNTTPVLYQQGTYAPGGIGDTLSRWMGSIAMDGSGNMALGYSVSSPIVFPGIRYTGRLVSDPLGQMPQGEATIIDGGGSQEFPIGRWGDYAAMTIDPSDDCTFWFTTEYIPVTTASEWKTRIGSFKFPSCVAGATPTPSPTPTGTPPTATSTRVSTNTPSPSPTPGCFISYESTDVPKPIIDTLTITSTLTVTGGPTIVSVEVLGLEIVHTFSSDLEAYLISPAGTRVELFSDVCDDNTWAPGDANFNLSDGATALIGTTCPPGTGTYRPQGALSALSGQSSSGTWVLEITDTAPPDEGTLLGWGLRIGSSGPCQTNTPVPPTNTPASTATATRTNTATFVPTGTAVPPTATSVPPTLTSTSTAVPPTLTSTSTSISTSTSTSISTATASPTMTCMPAENYTFTSSIGATVVPGASQVPGSTCNDCVVQITLPFPYSLYGQTFTTANASNKGVLQFSSASHAGANSCLPTAVFSNAILAFWDNLNTNINDNMGIYTSVSGTAPNRIFNIEWRSGYVANDVRSNFEVRLYEGQEKFDLIYGQVRGAGNGSSATIGVQRDMSRYTEYSCNTASVQTGTKLTFERQMCPTGPLRR